MINVGGELKERACDSLVMCIVTTLNQGLRNGGGIGDILRAPSSTVSITTQAEERQIDTNINVIRIAGAIVRCQGRIRSTVLLHRDNHRSESHFWCHHRYIRRSKIGEAAKGIDFEEHMLHMRQVSQLSSKIRILL